MEKFCEFDKKLLVRKKYEATDSWKKRRFCNHSCVGMAYSNNNNVKKVNKKAWSTEAKEQVFNNQEQLCLICQGHLGSITQAQGDHIHGTQLPRGLLCYRCNSGLGSFKDDSNLLAKAITYIKYYDNLYGVEAKELWIPAYDLKINDLDVRHL